MGRHGDGTFVQPVSETQEKQWWVKRGLSRAHPVGRRVIGGGKLGAREVCRGLAGELTTPPGPQEQRQRGCKRCGFNPWVGKIPWRRAWQPTPVFLSGEFHGQRSLAGYSPYTEESDAVEVT